MVVSGKTLLVIFVVTGTGFALECYKCDSRVKTQHNECDKGDHSVETELCLIGHQCYNGTYSWSKDGGKDRTEITIRGCGPIEFGCDSFLKYMQRKIGFELYEKQCDLCNTDFCNSSIRHLPDGLSLSFVLFLFLINKLF